MNSFVDIRTVFSGAADRTVDVLKKIYSDHDYLIDTLSEFTRRWLSEENIEGKTVLLKPNWVRHSIRETDEICLRTHESFLLAAVEVILRMDPDSVIIGDAPIQGCDWSGIVNEFFVDRINQLIRKYNIPIKIVDFRRTIFSPAQNSSRSEINAYDNYQIFDTGKDSFLESISSASSNPFRVTCYNPDRLADSHGPGFHKYCITKELFEADIVISLPKIKTHQKVGITGAIKNLVGLNGDKDFLPHHRIGGTGRGGDCYPGRNKLRYWSELALDSANRRQGKKGYRFWRKLSSFFWRLSFPGSVHQLAAGWYGNDTTWRMVLDINKIAVYGTQDCKISSKPQRVIYSLCDGIIAGQGDGPLTPVPLPLGIICFSSNSYLTDICMASLMGFDIRKVPLLIAAEKLVKNMKTDFIVNGDAVDLDELKKYAIETQPSPGWADYLEPILK